MSVVHHGVRNGEKIILLNLLSYYLIILLNFLEGTLRRKFIYTGAEVVYLECLIAVFFNIYIYFACFAPSP